MFDVKARAGCTCKYAEHMAEQRREPGALIFVLLRMPEAIDAPVEVRIELRCHVERPVPLISCAVRACAGGSVVVPG
jgi:hypothetical protein